jgi:hypothetical protein
MYRFVSIRRNDTWSAIATALAGGGFVDAGSSDDRPTRDKALSLLISKSCPVVVALKAFQSLDKILGRNRRTKSRSETLSDESWQSIENCISDRLSKPVFRLAEPTSRDRRVLRGSIQSSVLHVMRLCKIRSSCLILNDLLLNRTVEK